MGQLLSEADIARVRAEHCVVDVLGRLGIAPPVRWDGAADYMICCPCPDHDDSTPSCIVHPQTDRWNCFGCGAHGDVLELVRRTEGITSLRTIAEILDARRPLVPGGKSGAIGVRPSSAARIHASERPDPTRTSWARLIDANAAAWRYLTQPTLAQRGRGYLLGRGIDVSALEAETGQLVAGHTPDQPDGLVMQLRSRGFTDDEIVDAGWGARRDGQLIDRFRRRVIVPVRDEHGYVVGVYGRDVTGTAKQKYLNTAETAAFHKGSAVYLPSVTRLDAHATVVVCEGSLDALAIAAQAARASRSPHFAPVSPSGTALTDMQARMIMMINDRPPLVCADGDNAGLAASQKWVRTFMAHGRETIVTVLPNGHDPASWLHERGTQGLWAFVRKGCLERPNDAVKPVPAGALLAGSILAAETAAARQIDPNIETALVLPAVLRRLASEAVKVPGEAAAMRFATAAGCTLARLADGMNADGRAHQVLDAINRHARSVAPAAMTQPERQVDRGIEGGCHAH